MLTRIMKPREDRDAGFTLIELLVVVAIIGILAAIAIPVFLNQRASARDASVKSDINSVAKVMETVYTDAGALPGADGDEALLQDADVVSSPGNYIVVVPSARPDSQVFGCNVESDNGWYYSSADGGLNPEGQTFTGAGCDTAGGVAGEPSIRSLPTPACSPHRPDRPRARLSAQAGQEPPHPSGAAAPARAARAHLSARVRGRGLAGDIPQFGSKGLVSRGRQRACWTKESGRNGQTVRNGRGIRVDIQRIDDYAGLRRELEIGLTLAPTRASAVAAAKSVAAYLDADPRVTVRLAGLGSDDSRILITLAVTLGTVDEIKVADARLARGRAVRPAHRRRARRLRPRLRAPCRRPASFEARAARARAWHRVLRRCRARSSGSSRSASRWRHRPTTTSSSPPATDWGARSPTWWSAGWTSARSWRTPRHDL